MHKQDKNAQVDRVEIEYYTDPLCCWSWAFEPQWRKLRFEYSGQIVWRYRMGGLLPNWDRYNDPLNSVNRPIQMGPVWMEAHHTSGMPINNRLWFEDPPGSSYPACVAVKCAELQSPEAAEAYLRSLRETVMVESLNIGKEEVLLSVGEKVGKSLPHIFDTARFATDVKNDAGIEKFREDMQKASYHKISRFPTLTLKRPNKPGVVITGYRPYSVLVEALQQAAPGIQPSREIKNADDYESFWGSVLPREMEEIKVDSKSKKEL